MINRLTALFILINRCLRIISFCWSLSLFSAIILKAEEKSCWLFVEGTCWPVQKCVIPAALYWKTENYKTLIFCFHLPCRTQRRCIISTRRSLKAPFSCRRATGTLTPLKMPMPDPLLVTWPSQSACAWSFKSWWKRRNLTSRYKSTTAVFKICVHCLHGDIN